MLEGGIPQPRPQAVVGVVLWKNEEDGVRKWVQLNPERISQDAQDECHWHLPVGRGHVAAAGGLASTEAERPCVEFYY